MDPMRRWTGFHALVVIVAEVVCSRDKAGSFRDVRGTTLNVGDVVIVILSGPGPSFLCGCD